ncbi:hypothetical protein PQO01_02675 [Lentisphaera marina]|uniref:hypothetical protein n=1 Tax=Lentisphaera marina TaxID=1111041 RepID=UPI002365988F|nr:hypothetical protein [Lentisphaera marina]MDD7983852.1 hypothetical protein [Lentisphaera marina]
MNLKSLIIIICLSFSSYAKIYTLSDIELQSSKSDVLKEKVIWAYIYQKDKSAIIEQIKDLRKNKLIDILDFYQFMNLLKNKKDFDKQYYVDEDLKILKELSLNLSNEEVMTDLLKDKINNQFVYDYFIYQAFHNYKSYMDPFILKLKSSENQKKLFIKYNYEKGNIIYLKRMINQASEKGKKLLMDLIIASGVKMSISEKIKLLEKRNELEYEIEYSYMLLDLYEKEEHYFSMLAEIDLILSQEKSFYLVQKIINLKASEIDQTSFAKFAEKVEPEKINNLRYMIIKLVYDHSKSFDEILPETESDENFKESFIYYKAIQFILINEIRKAYLLINADEEKFSKNEDIKLLQDKIKIMLDINVDQVQSPYKRLSQRLQEQNLIIDESLSHKAFVESLKSKELNLSDFYEAYDRIGEKDPIAYVECFFIYKTIFDGLNENQQNSVKEKMDALGFE